MTEIIADLRSADEWWSLAESNPALFDKAYIRSIVDRGLRDGVDSLFFGHIPSDQVEVGGENYREYFAANGLNSRQRAVLEIFAQHAGANPRIFAHEAITRFAMIMRGRYPRFLGSEYADDEKTKRELYPIPAIDITQSNLPAGTFDFVLTNEVLEHVPDLDAALADTARILAPGGKLIGTFPFLMNSRESYVRARIQDGKIVHLVEPEYHGNPIDPSGGSLVFEVPAWDIIERSKRCGFFDCYMIYYSSFQRGITASDTAGIFVFVATK
jgi:SAM-dependent methyltransferase